METLPEEIRRRAMFWAEDQSFDRDTRSEVKTLVDSSQYTEIVDRFYRDLQFGTGGMRGKMGAGTARVNRYNIRRATSALAEYLTTCRMEGAKKIAIAYDSRHNSKEYARECAGVFAAYGYKVYLTAEMRPVPMLSFMVRYFQCHAGVCITASHNPKEYNGFKVYWKDGGQLVPPHDRAVTEFYRKRNDLSQIPYLSYSAACQQGKIEEVGEQLDLSYFNKLRDLAPQSYTARNLKIIYTPLHGTGIHVIPDALKCFGFHDIATPPAQAIPDGNFPTVASPNPEDPEALDAALQMAREHQADLILGTDPDADRAACIVKLRDGSYYTLSGNQIICLLTDYLLHQQQEKNHDLSQQCVISTIVTSPMLNKITKSYGCHYFETLTGFKWICHLIEAFEEGRIEPALKFLCGGEESFGFLWGEFVRDKDAILTCAILADMVESYKTQGQDLMDRLHQLYQKFGIYSDSLHTFTHEGKAGADKISRLMATLRQSPPATLGGNKLTAVQDHLDPEQGTSRWLQDPRTLPSENVLQFYFEGGTRLSIRPSGTEPKIKLYLTSVTQPSASTPISKDMERAQLNHTTLATEVLSFLGKVS